MLPRKFLDLGDHSLQKRPVVAHGGQLFDQVFFDLSSADRADGTFLLDAVDLRQALVIEVDLGLPRLRQAHHRTVAIAAANQTLKKEPVPVGSDRLFMIVLVVGLQELLRGLEDFHFHDGLVLAGELEAGSLVGDRAHVNLALQDAAHAVRIERLAAEGFALLRLVRLAPVAQPAQLVRYLVGRFLFQVHLEDAPDQPSLFVVDDQQLVLEVVAQRGQAAAPQTFLGAGDVKIFRALLVQLAVVLRELDHDVDHEPALRGLRIEALRGGHEGHVVFLEQLHEAVEIATVAREAVELVDDDRLDAAFLNRLEQALHRRAL